MESKQIIKNIHEIYSKLKTPKNLQMHMLRSAALDNLLVDNWEGSKLNKEDIIAVELIHDLGNIVKMDLY